MLSTSSSGIESATFEEKPEDKIHKEENCAVMSIKQSNLFARVRKSSDTCPSLSSGYGSEDDDLSDNKISEETGGINIITSEFDNAVPSLKCSGLSEEDTADFKDELIKFSPNREENKAVISVTKQEIVEDLEYPEWASEVPEIKYSPDDDLSVDKMFGEIPTSDLCKIENLTLEFDTNMNQLLEENCDSSYEHSKYTEDLRTLCAGVDSGSVDINKLMDENYDELDKKIHCHRLSMEKIVTDILEMTKATEDYVQENTEKELAAAFDEVLGFHQEVESPDNQRHKDDFTEKNICNSEECPTGVRKPNETPSEFLNNVNSSVQFFHGFCSGYRAPSRHHYVPQNSQPAHLGPNLYGESCNPAQYQISEQNFYPWKPLCNLSTESHSSYLPKTEWYDPKAPGKNPQRKLSSWSNEEATFSAGITTRPSSEILDEKQILETSYTNSSPCSNDSLSSSRPVEDFFNSLYLPEDLLPSEIISGTIATKRRTSTDNFLSVDSMNTARSSSLDDSLCAMKSSSSDCSFSTRSKNNRAEKSDTSEVYNTDIWGDEKQTYWKPLPACPAMNVERPSRADNPRPSRGRKFKSTAPPNGRYTSKSRRWSESCQRKCPS